MLMTTDLWSDNTPAQFWRCVPDVPEEQWQAATARAISQLNLPVDGDEAALLAFALGEGWRGADRWRLSSTVRTYYRLKPLIPRWAIRRMRRLHAPQASVGFQLGWPIEDRYARFQWEVARQLLLLRGEPALHFYHFWPEGRRYGLVLTHDVETAQGQSFVRAVAELEESYGFRSSFNFVPERYPLDYPLLQELRERGFEIGLHGLKHDGKLFWSQNEFMRRARRINDHLQAMDAVGFRAPLNHRHPEWMQELQIEYDLSFFDTDPYEPLPGGSMSIWPFFLGHFVELPSTLVQDHTLVTIMGERSPRLWLQKMDFIERYHGLALLNAHPDYLMDQATLDVYADFLQAMRERSGYWHGLARDAARWWRTRAGATDGKSPALTVGSVTLAGDTVAIL